ncbi:hypothetical protein RchiOBHm_Chr3g0469161 [Rosa chinensis]|uniref:Uncharacterized protein n=1 Tax=Rosa chinensis TaxID=74649 RepID=A0A2P6RAQ7_ROSCH|nr:hypothetical protein RchiOBHm_Chr3g0469161 [Rosa chinensis]
MLMTLIMQGLTPPPPPTEKVFGDRDISDWEWLCDNLYTDQAYQNRCRINTINRNKKIYNHCGGSRPFTKHMEAEEQVSIWYCLNLVAEFHY